MNGNCRGRLGELSSARHCRESSALHAPAVFLLVVTAAVLLVRSTLRSDSSCSERRPLAVDKGRDVADLAASRPRPPKQYYVIPSGDTLDAIASRFATTVELCSG